MTLDFHLRFFQIPFNSCFLLHQSIPVSMQMYNIFYANLFYFAINHIAVAACGICRAATRRGRRRVICGMSESGKHKRGQNRRHKDHNLRLHRLPLRHQKQSPVNSDRQMPFSADTLR